MKAIYFKKAQIETFGKFKGLQIFCQNGFEIFTDIWYLREVQCQQTPHLDGPWTLNFEENHKNRIQCWMLTRNRLLFETNDL